MVDLCLDAILHLALELQQGSPELENIGTGGPHLGLASLTLNFVNVGNEDYMQTLGER